MMLVVATLLLFVTVPALLLAAWYCPHDLVWPVKGEKEDEYAFICARCKAVEKKVGKEWKWTRR